MPCPIIWNFEIGLYFRQSASTDGPRIGIDRFREIIPIWIVASPSQLLGSRISIHHESDDVDQERRAVHKDVHRTVDDRREKCEAGDDATEGTYANQQPREADHQGYPEAFPDIPRREPSEGAIFQSLQDRIYRPGGLLCLSSHVSGTEVTQPKQFGSHASRLILTLLHAEAHRKDVTLSKDEWQTLVTWVDANAPYHSTYFQYFDSRGKLLPRPLRVRIDLDPPFNA